MATNNNGNLVDDKGSVVVDFVWGNLPIQPNDDRVEPALLDVTLDNHSVAYSGYNGYPLYVPNTDGASIDGDTPADGIQADEVFINVPNILGRTTALAIDALEDAGFVTTAGVNTITTATAATNAAKSITLVTRTAGSTEVSITATGAVAAYPVGTKITVSSTGTVDGTWTVTGNSSTNVVKFTSTASTVLTAGTGSVVGVEGTIKTQSVAAAATSIAPATAITITPWAVAS